MFPPVHQREITSAKGSVKCGLGQRPRRSSFSDDGATRVENRCAEKSAGGGRVQKSKTIEDRRHRRLPGTRRPVVDLKRDAQAAFGNHCGEIALRARLDGHASLACAHEDRAGSAGSGHELGIICHRPYNSSRRRRTGLGQGAGFGQSCKSACEAGNRKRKIGCRAAVHAPCKIAVRP